jgi:hypothetical protein
LRDDAPILLIHYGPAAYLRRTLLCARKTNPDKRIILLGDSSNRRFAAGTAEFFPFEEFSAGTKHARFQEVFQMIQGERHRFNKHGGVEVWLKFVFRRWFLIEKFLSREGLDSFWTFDSDTLVLAPLGPRECRFQEVEATTQCRGECLNGWVGSLHLVHRYTSCILKLFSEASFLDAQRERLRIHAGLAFNEMDAFTEFRRRESIKTWHGEEPVDGEIFDDALAFTNGFEVAPEKILGKTFIKRLWTDGKSIYTKQKESGQLVRMLTCNMSWMPDYMWRRISRCARGGSPDLGDRQPDIPALRELDVREPLAERCRRECRNMIWRLRQHWKRR